MQLSSTLSWLVDAAGEAPGADRLLAELGARLVADGLPLAGGALTLAVPHPLIARRTWLWWAASGEVIEALGFVAGGSWREGSRPASCTRTPSGPGRTGLRSAGSGRVRSRPARPMRSAQQRAPPRRRSPLSRARATLTAALEAYLGRSSAARVLAGPLRRGIGETIQAALLCADLRDFTALSEATESVAMIAALDAWFDRIAGAVHAFGGEVLKFIGDGVLAIFPVGGAPAAACEAALRAVVAARAGMAHLDAVRQAQGLPPLPFGAALHLGEMLWGNIGGADRLDFHDLGPAVNLVSRLEGLCRPLGRSVLISGAVAAETNTRLIALGEHELRGIATPCAVFTLPED